jgi:predicted nucleotidyltransferase
MRLSINDINIIKVNILNIISDAKIILFGSRVYDEKKGGDIDIFVQTNNIVTIKEQIMILTNIELSGILRKVDLIVKMQNSKELPIYKTAIREGIIL